MNMNPFRANYEIDNPKLLFGRKKELANLCDYAEGMHQVEIVGARRFGKTCLIKSFIKQQKENVKRKTYPIYVDVYSDGIKGTTNVYRYLTSQLVANLLTDGYIEERELTIDDFVFIPNRKWRKVYKQLGAVEDEIDQIGIFEDAIKAFSHLIKQTMLFIFDEYEKAVDAFDNINGLMCIRKLTNESNSLSFWIVGASPWKKYILNCSQDVRGSGVFNGITINVNVCPLKKEDFHDMWDYECSLITDGTKRKHLNSLWEKVFASSGGVPCFAKEIGAFTYIENKYPQYNRLNNHFVELEKNLTESEIKHLRMLSFSSQKYTDTEKPEPIVSLEQYGFIRINDNNMYYIASRFFAEYLRAKVYEEQLKNDTETNSLDTIVDEIEETFYKINDKWSNLHNKFMFDPTNDTQRLYKDLRLKCDRREKIPTFINSIYLLYWEGAKENKAGEKIPHQFKSSMFRKSMDRIRHILGKAHQQDKLEQYWGQLDKATALIEIWGDSVEPQTSHDWLYFQECMLKRFLQELNDIYESIGNQSIGKVYSTPITSNNPKVVVGVFKKGIAGRKAFVMQDSTGYLQEIRNIREGEKLKDGDVVVYYLCSEPNPIDPSKKFWFAEDVHLK